MTVVKKAVSTPHNFDKHTEYLPEQRFKNLKVQSDIQK